MTDKVQQPPTSEASTPGAEPGRCVFVDDDEGCEKPREVKEHRPCGNIYNDGGPGFCGTISCHKFQPAAPAPADTVMSTPEEVEVFFAPAPAVGAAAGERPEEEKP